MVILCVIAVLAALAGFAAVGVALGPVAGAGAVALLMAPLLGAASLATGTAAAVIALRRGV